MQDWYGIIIWHVGGIIWYKAQSKVQNDLLYKQRGQYSDADIF
jgi:hypothetical protein